MDKFKCKERGKEAFNIYKIQAFKQHPQMILSSNPFFICDECLVKKITGEI